MTKKRDAVALRHRALQIMAEGVQRRALKKDVKERAHTRAWKHIYKILVEPILCLNSGNFWGDFDWLSLIFDTKNRIIENYVVKKDFEMPGGLMLTPKLSTYSPETPGIRNIKAGDLICIRVDNNVPEVVDVEVAENGDWERPTRWFKLTKRQWEEDIKQLMKRK